MGTQGGAAGKADYLSLGEWNATCSMCGRKRKPSHMVRNWQGQYRCPEHDEPRQPQDFARGIAEKPAAPWVQTYQVGFVSVTPTFAATATPSSVIYVVVVDQVIGTESGDILGTESGEELGINEGTVSNITLGGSLGEWPSWIIPNTTIWSWQSGGDGIEIVSPTTPWTEFYVATANESLSGVAQFVVTDPWGRTGTALVTVELNLE